jgi:hypothetical protein
MPHENSSEGVGYGRPPKQHQFKPKQSGNPRGRPKKSARKPKPGEIDIAGILNAEFTVPTASGERKMSAFEIVCRALTVRAINDRNLRAAIEFVKLCESYKVIRTPPRRKTHGVLVLRPGATREEIERQYYDEEPAQPRMPKRKGKRADRATVLQAVAYERVGKGKKKRTTFELVLEVIQKAGFDGKPTAVRMINELHDRYDQPADSSVGGFLVVPGMATDLEAFAKEAEEQQRQFREARDNCPEAGDPAPVDRKGPSNRS